MCMYPPFSPKKYYNFSLVQSWKWTLYHILQSEKLTCPSSYAKEPVLNLSNETIRRNHYLANDSH